MDIGAEPSSSKPSAKSPLEMSALADNDVASPPVSNMAWLQANMQGSTIVSRPDDEVSRIKLTLPSPGQRGIVQAIVQGKRDLQSIRPQLKQVAKASKPQLKHHERQQHVQSRLVAQVDRVKRYCHELNNKHTARKEEAKANGDTEPPVISAEDWEHAIQKILKGMEAIEKGTSAAQRLVLNDKQAAKLDTTVQEVEKLSADLRHQIDNQQSMGTSWMHTKWTREASTAVGRGPPGHLAFSPFTIHDPPFERNEVLQVILDGPHQYRNHHAQQHPQVAHHQSLIGNSGVPKLPTEGATKK